MSEMNRSSIQLAKSALRQELKRRLQSMSPEERSRQSEIVTDLVLNSAEYEMSRRVCIYLNMAEEVSTKALLAHIFKTGRQCFVPRYTKKEMEMLQLSSMEDFENLPFTKWNIRQPEPGVSEDEHQRQEALSSGGLDLIILPALGFSLNSMSGEWVRLGRGKGYYDTYLEKCENLDFKPITVGLAFKEQILDSIPSSPHDRPVQRVFHG